MKKNILITGKNGFIGKRIRGGKAFKKRLNVLSLLEQTKDVNGIVHLAAKSNNFMCHANPRATIQSNLLGLCDVLEVAYKQDIWVLFISTFQVKEKNLYGLTKLVGEELCRIYQDWGVRVKILRLPIVYGEDDKSYKVVTKIINKLKKGMVPSITTKKKFYFAYVNDVAKAIEREVNIVEGGFGKKYSLCDLTKGIEKCLNKRRSK